MFYSKLPVVLLSEMAAHDRDSTNGRIAAYLLGHLSEVKHDSIREMAAKMKESPSAISRFCRTIGLEGFNELKDLLAATSLRFEVCSDSASHHQQKEDYVSAVQDSLERVRKTVDMEKVYQLAEDIRRYPRVSIFGLLKSEAVAMDLQSDLAMLGRQCTTKVRYAQQAECLARAGADDLIIIFSFTGAYFDYGIPKGYRQNRKDRPKVYMITSAAAPPSRSDLYDETVWFESLQDQASYPFQLQLVGSLIAQCYAHLLREGRPETAERPGPA